MRVPTRPVLAATLCLLPLALGCRPMEPAEELQALAGEVSPEPPAAKIDPPASAFGGSRGSGATGADDGLEAFPLGGAVFPGLGGRLHSSLCDPADPHSTCI